jgi:TonB family protein
MLLVATIVVCASASAQAGCDPSTKYEGPTLSDEKLAIRDGVFQKLCERSGGKLIDGNDGSFPTRRIQLVPTGKMLQHTFSRETIERPPRDPAVIVATVDTTGRVTWAAVLNSSGSKEVDAVAAATIRAMTFKPAVLDGQPVAVFITIPYRFRVA